MLGCGRIRNGSVYNLTTRPQQEGLAALAFNMLHSIFLNLPYSALRIMRERREDHAIIVAQALNAPDRWPFRVALGAARLLPSW